MPRVYLTSSQYKHVYSNDLSVGAGGANRRDDVLLVQFFLKVANEEGGEFPALRPQGQRPTVVDGICGGQTKAYIRAFQEERRRRGSYSGPIDGRVDPIADGFAGIRSAKEDTAIMIVTLNFVHSKKRGLEKHADIATSADFPLSLNNHFYLRYR